MRKSMLIFSVGLVATLLLVTGALAAHTAGGDGDDTLYGTP